MATVQEVARAIRQRFGPTDTPVRLSELLFFVESLPDLPARVKDAKRGEPKQVLNGNRLKSSIWARQSQPQPANT